MPTRKRTIIYVDGFNLYYGALKDTPGIKWLDLERFFLMLRNEDDIVQINYFTTRVGGAQSRKDQLTYLTALSTRPLIEIIEGRFKPKRLTCRVPACRYPGDRTFVRLEEKRTDVNIAVRMLEDAVDDRCDLFVLVSGDSDLVPAVQTIKRRCPQKEIFVYVPAVHIQRAHAVELRGAADKERDLPIGLLRRAQFPATLSDGSGGTITKPADW